jgi:hypothetical protein
MTAKKHPKTNMQPTWFKAELHPKPNPVSITNDGSNKYRIYTIMMPVRLAALQTTH